MVPTMWELSVLLMLVAAVKCFEFRGEGKTIYSENLTDDTAVHVCSKDNSESPESVRITHKTFNGSLAVNINRGGIEHIHGDGQSGFGILPTEDPNIVIVRAWHKEGGKSAKLKINIKTGQILDSQIFNDFADVMCYKNELMHYRRKRGTFSESVKYALEQACHHLLDFSLGGSICSISTGLVCSVLEDALVTAISFPGASFVWSTACKGITFLLCGEVGSSDSTTVNVCAIIEEKIKDFIG